MSLPVPPLIVRQRLIDAVRRGLAYGVMLVSAPRGSGKRTLLSQIPEARLRIELPSKARPQDVATALGVPWSEHPKPTALVATLARRLAEVEGPVVVENIHRLNDDACALLSALIDATAPHTHWLLAGNRVPASLPVGAWIERHWLTLPLTADDLAFSVDETVEFAAAHGLTISPEDAEHLRTAVDGWATGIELQIEAQLRGHRLDDARCDRVSELLAKHVLPTLRDGDLEIITLLAIGGPQRDDTLAEITALPNVDAVVSRVPLLRRSGRTTAANPRLAAAVRAHAPRDTLERLGETLAARSIDRGEPAAALRLAHELRVPRLVLRVIELTAPRLIDVEQALLREAIDALPASSMSLPTVRAMRGLLAERADHLAVAEPILRRLGTLPEPLAAAVALSKSRLANIRGDFETGLADAAPYVDHSDPLIAVDAGLQMCLALARLRRREDARRLIVKLQRQIDELPIDYQAPMLDRVSMIHYHLAEYQTAEAIALRAANLARERNDPVTLARVNSKLFAAAQWIYDIPTLQRYVDNWLAAARGINNETEIAIALCTSASLSAEQGDVGRYRELAAECRGMRRFLPPEWDFYVRWAQAIVDIAEGHRRQAASMLSAFHDGESTREALARALEAFAWAGAGEAKHAQKALSRIPEETLPVADADLGTQAIYAASYRALALWMLDRGRAARAAFPLFASHQLPARDQIVIAAMQAICNVSRATMTRARLDLLTEPILEVGLTGHALLLRNGLRLDEAIHEFSVEALAVFQDLSVHGGTSRDIASRLNLSPGTVDWHVKQICRRTGTSGRSAALRYLSERGLL